MCLLLFFTACIDTKNTNTAKLEKELYKGTEGASLTFLDENFPSEVYEGEDISLVIKVTNKGPYLVENPKLLVNVEKGYMEFSGGNNVFTTKEGLALDGKTIYNNFDDFSVIEVSMKTKEIDAYSEYHDALITTNFCYDYRGIAIAEACIDTDPHGVTANKKACTAQDTISLSEGQGGPVVITRVEPRMLVQNNQIIPQFKIFITNQGTGDIIKYGSTEQACSSDYLQEGTYNSVTLKEIRLGNSNTGFECLPREIQLMQNEDSITCTYTGSISKSTPAYMTPLKIEIEYGYIDSISKEIKIKNLPG